MAFDRTREDTSNIVLLEHINLTQPDQRLATLFYVVGLQFTRDPYLMVGLSNMWINIGRTQMHLPTRESQAQRLRGTIGLVVRDLDQLERSLATVGPQLASTKFAFERYAGHIDVVCPWGNCFRCHPPDAARWGATQLGIVYVQLDVPAGAAAPISEFYRVMLGAPVQQQSTAAGLNSVSVGIGADQRLNFVETRGPPAAYDGHHLQIYLADFSGPYQRLKERGLISRETDAHEWRFIDIVDLDTGNLVWQLEHEVRSMRHPLFARPLVNRNAQQSNSAYVKGHDAFRGSF